MQYVGVGTGTRRRTREGPCPLPRWSVTSKALSAPGTDQGDEAASKTFQPFSLASAVGSEEGLSENRPSIASCGGRAPIDEVSLRCYLIPQGK